MPHRIEGLVKVVDAAQVGRGFAQHRADVDAHDFHVAATVLLCPAL
jgi:hypothetical protein